MSEVDVRGAFLAGARAVADAVARPEVAEMWDRPSVLEDQTVGSLAGHLARGSVWVVGEYLATTVPVPDGGGGVGGEAVELTYASAAEYYAGLMGQLSDADHAAVRQRGEAIAAEGHSAVVATLRTRLEELTSALDAAPPDQLIAVINGSIMRLDDYLGTRIVEQAVHIDDLARSVGGGGGVGGGVGGGSAWPYPDECQRLALEIGVEIGRLRHGNVAMLRALYRTADPTPLPVLNPGSAPAHRPPAFGRV